MSLFLLLLNPLKGLKERCSRVLLYLSIHVNSDRCQVCTTVAQHVQYHIFVVLVHGIFAENSESEFRHLWAVVTSLLVREK